MLKSSHRSATPSIRCGLTRREFDDLHLALKTARELLTFISESLTAMPPADDDGARPNPRVHERG